MKREEAIECIKSIIDVYKILVDKQINSDVPLDNEDIQALEMAISALSENKGEWIPVIERLPKDGELVLCSVANSNYSVVINCFENQSYWRDGTIYAWQPLPEPYKAESEEV